MALELHFVRRKMEGPNNPRNSIAVIGVKAVADVEENTENDVWSDLKVTEVQD